MTARLSQAQLPEAPDIAAGAEALRDRAAGMAQADATAYGLFVSELRSTRKGDPLQRRQRLLAALSEAAQVPLEIAEVGAAVAALAARLAEDGNPNLLGDAVTAALLAEAACRSAAGLVMINLRSSPGDDRLGRALRAVAESAKSAGRARVRAEG
jgi:formiminotetrahydrofolate cyclodeaminase